MADVVVLWEEVDKHLPLGQDPVCRQVRKDLFKKLLPKGKKTLSLEDVQKGMKTELRHDMGGSYVPGVREMTKCIRSAFRASSELAPPSSPCKTPKTPKRDSSAKIDSGIQHSPSKKNVKGKDSEFKGKSVDKREFHAFLVSLRYYLELEELFEILDECFDDDQKLSLRECLKGKDKLAEWGISEELLRDRFSDVDPWTAYMTFDQFSDWIMEFRWEAMGLKLDDSDDEEVQFELGAHTIRSGVDITFSEMGAASELNRMAVQDTFRKWDSDGSGGISLEEMTEVMKELNPKFSEAKVKRLFEAADTSKDGIIDFDEFLRFIFKQSS